MSSTYTLNNGIELIGTGEQSGTWGATTNTNFELLDTALDGQVTITASSAGSSGSPNSLPVSDGAASNGRNRLVNITSGTDLGATVYYQLTPSDAEKIIYIRNSLNAQSLIVFQGTYNASNDYEIPNGKTAIIFFNGAGSGAVAANVMSNAHFDALNIVGNASVGGTLAVTSTSTFSDDVTFTGASYNVVWDKSDNALEFADNAKAVFGAGSDLQIYHDGSNSYVSELGTGDLRLGAVNIRIGDNTSGASYIYATQNAEVTLYHNNSPKLATTSSGINVTGNILRMDGTAPMMYFMETGVTDSNHRIRQNTGNLYFQKLSDDTNTATTRMAIDGGTGDISFYEDTGTTPKFFWDASAESLGIGTTSLSSATFSNFYQIEGTYPGVVYNSTAGGTNYKYSTGVDDNVWIVRDETAAATRLLIDSSGNVGIGTSSPAANRALHVSSTAQNQARFERTGAAISQIEFDDSTTTNQPSLGGEGDDLTFRTAFTERMRIDSGGNLLVGRSSNLNGARTLVTGTKSGTNGTNGLLVVLDEQSYSTTDNGGGISFAGDFYNGGQVVFATVQGVKENNTDANDAGALKFTTKANGANQVEAMRIDSSGNLILKATSDTGNRLQINGADETSELLEVGITSGYAQLTATHASGGSNTAGFIFRTRNGTAGTNEKMRLDAAGNLLVGTTNGNPTGNHEPGTLIFNEGQINVHRDGGNPLRVGRDATDGNLTEWYRQGALVGNAGIQYSDNFYVAGNSSHTGIGFGSSTIYPVDSTGTERDDHTNLGSSNGRFKDLYLSGGVYLGGTGAANKLSEYDQGSFTPTWDGYAPASTAGAYVRIGQMVYVSMKMVTASSSDFSGVQVNNLPFTVANETAIGGGMVWADNASFYDAPNLTQLLQNTTQCVLKTITSSDTYTTREYVGRNPQIGGSTNFTWNIIYRTND